MRLPILALCLGLSLAAAAHGQAIYNPYAKTDDDLSPIKDGKLNWPAFFKSKKLEDRFQAYFAMGSCVGTKQAVNNMLRDNKVDVNALPEATVRGISIGCDLAALTIAAPGGPQAVVLAHPAGVTKVSVAGSARPSDLKSEMLVRFLGKVDKRGTGVEPVRELEVFTPGAEFVWPPVEAEKMQPIVAKVTQIKGERMSLRVEAGKMRRLNVQVKPDAKVKMDGRSLLLAGPGDEVTTTGHVYVGPGAGGQQVVFASEIIVTKALSAAKGEVPTRSTDMVVSETGSEND